MPSELYASCTPVPALSDLTRTNTLWCYTLWCYKIQDPAVLTSGSSDSGQQDRKFAAQVDAREGPGARGGGARARGRAGSGGARQRRRRGGCGGGAAGEAGAARLVLRGLCMRADVPECMSVCACRSGHLGAGRGDVSFFGSLQLCSNTGSDKQGGP